MSIHQLLNKLKTQVPQYPGRWRLEFPREKNAIHLLSTAPSIELNKIK